MNNSVNRKITPQELDRLHDEIKRSELSLLELFYVVWKSKSVIVIVTMIFAVASALLALYLPNIYRSEVTLVSAENQDTNTGLVNELGGLASLAGVSLGDSKSTRAQLALEVLESHSFFSYFINKRDILKDLMAVKRWEAASGNIIYNNEIYNSEKEEWVREVQFPKTKIPSSQEAFNIFLNSLNVEEDKSTGIIHVSIEHLSPFVAQKWVTWLVEDINQVMRDRDMEEAKKMISYLEDELGRTHIAEMKTVLFDLIKKSTKTVMLASVLDEYVFKTIDEAVVPELKDSPKRVFICLLGSVLGFILSVLFYLFRYFLSYEEEK